MTVKSTQSQNELRGCYAQKALAQIPRLLSNQDRNPFSPTYGCFHRDYWLDKTSDFPDAVRQFGVHALALVYKCNFPGSIYYGQSKIRDWTIAGLDFWTKIQHRDGSFDEFYPYERGWVGPSAFTTFTSIEAYRLLADDVPSEIAHRVRNAIRRAAYFIAAGESEEDHLANHHAMACLAVWKAYEMLREKKLEEGYNRLWQGFLSYHNREEGWSREYDGVDPGYLSATVSFLTKLYLSNPDPRILEVLRQSVVFCSYFVYPNGFFGGSLGSRNTLHFYPHGFEALADKIPLAAAIAESMLKALTEDKLVPPEIISDRYVFYRVPEYLQAYLDYKPRTHNKVLLPFQQEPFTNYFSEAKIFIHRSPSAYLAANLAKGGVIKIFSTGNSKKILLNDCGLIGELSDGSVVTSQWIDSTYKYDVKKNYFEVSGQLNIVPSNKLFSPLKFLLFRTVLVVMGWMPFFSHFLKGIIRKSLILGARTIPIHFRRRCEFFNTRVVLSDSLQIRGSQRFVRLSIGDEFFVRYVPQSRYFQSQELELKRFVVEDSIIQRMNEQRHYHLQREIDLLTGTMEVKEE